MKLTVRRSRAGLTGEVAVPGDKSISHRAVLLGAIARGATEITGFLASADCLRTLRIVRKLGVEVRGNPAEKMVLVGRGPDALREPDDVLYAGNSGTTARLTLGLLAGLPFYCALTGDASLRRRPMKRVVEPLAAMGALIDGRSGGERLPLGVTGRHPLRALHYHLPVPSAQVKSALLLAGLRGDGETSVSEDLRSRDHTERMMAAFGAPIRIKGTSVTISPGELESTAVAIPGDISSAAFFMVAASCLPESDLLLLRVGMNPTRTGLIDILRTMGADIEPVDQGVSGGEAWADLRVRSASLRGVDVPPDMAPRLIDEVPALAVAACIASGETTIRGVAELRVKESDRLAVIEQEFRKLGANLEAGPDYLRVLGGQTLHGAQAQSHGDHRIAMALAVAAMLAEGETLIHNTACIDTSFPGFARILARLASADLASI